MARPLKGEAIEIRKADGSAIDWAAIEGGGGGGSGTQYTEGDVDATITGTALLWEDASDTLRAVSAGKPLPTQVADGGNVTLGATGDASTANTVIGRLKKLISLLPTALGQMTKANSLAVVLPSDYQAPVLPTNLAVNGTAAVLNADIVAAFDSTNYRSLSLQLTGTFSASVQVQVSNDGGTTWIAVRGVAPGGSPNTTFTTTNLYLYPLPLAALCRVRCTAYTSGTVNGSAVFSTLSAPLFDRGFMQLMSAGGVQVGGASSQADAVSNTTAALYVTAFMEAYNGASFDRVRIATKYVDINAVAIGSIASLLTPTTSKKYRILGGTISVSAAASVLFEDNTAGNFIFRTPKLLADTPYTFNVIGNGTLSAAANNVLKATSSAAANLTGTLYYVEE